MIIVGQDRRCITEKLDLYIKNYNLDDGTVVYMIESNELRLAKYKTEERAKEVLQEITEEYLNCNIEYCGMSYVKNKVYEMPKE